MGRSCRVKLKKVIKIKPDFMDPNRKERFTESYFSDLKAFPEKEVLPLKYSKLDRFLIL
jgi:hypothetical protein